MQRDRAGLPDSHPLLYRFGRVVCPAYFALMHGVRWVGAENIPRTGPAIIAANHQSYYDPVIISLTVRRRIIFAGWDRFFRYPVLGYLLRSFSVVPVDVDAPGPSSYASLLRALRAGDLCGIFPEGGRTPDGMLQPPQPGVGALALATGAPVVPVTVHGAHRAWPLGNALPTPARIELFIGEPMTFRRCSGARSHERRAEITLAVMHRIADGFAKLGRPDLAQTTRRRLTRTDAS